MTGVWAAATTEADTEEADGAAGKAHMDEAGG